MKANLPPIGLGTAQLGQKYGISNQTGKPTPEQAQEILRFAWDHGVRHFDTSQEYGESEKILGKFFQSLSAADRDSAVVTTKVSRALLSATPAVIENSIIDSCKNLVFGSIWGVMLYGDDAVDWYPAMEALEKCRDDKLVEHLGLSVTYPREAFDALNDPRVDFIQVPYNAWNPTMQRHRVFKVAQKLGKVVFLRSVFLQGLIVAPARQSSCKLPVAHQAAYKWENLLAKLDFGDAIQSALRFALRPGLPVVVGAETLRQLRQTMALGQLGPLTDDAWISLYEAMKPCVNPSILDPRLWEVK